ncbi:hypothetical protein ACIP9H_39980 [Streptomyces sp. NPDC088732]|uniref:hypothetical protein n=1 Tax=Streptomyces sp. NPDC088732 TaxID=3365879 RepID=UPI00381EA057
MGGKIGNPPVLLQPVQSMTPISRLPSASSSYPCVARRPLFRGDEEPVDEVELARQRGGDGPGHALVDDPEQLTALGLVDVEVEFLGEPPAQGFPEVFAVLDGWNPHVRGG